jgi:dienelactone hydrolase
LSCAVALVHPAPGATVSATADDGVFAEALVIAPVGRSGRSAVHTDAIEAAIAAGKWSSPKPDDTITLPDGATRRWESVRANADGVFQHRSLAGGYAYVAATAPSDRVMLLDAAGHGMVYVNGEPRVGDPYSSGWVRTPVWLRAGANDLLFHVGRGQLRARLVAPKSVVQFDLADTTLPDLIVGQPVDTHAAVVVLNASIEPAAELAIETMLPGGEEVRTVLPDLLPLTVRKVGIRVSGPAPTTAGEMKLELKLVRRGVQEHDARLLDSASIALAAKQPTATHKRTFVSAIDGSVQYFAVAPAKKGGEPSDVSDQQDQTGRLTARPALILTLHGAGVEAIGQANAYLQKDWAYFVAPTNRRPFGFDWEDWGRLDAMEVLDLAEREWRPSQTYLTGHSMGGHGVWQIGAHFPARFAAVGPSAGWVSMYSYAGARRPEDAGPMQEILARSASASDTLALARNYLHHGVYVLHGEKDDNVPVGQARTMKRVLDEFHSDFAYHEEPGMGHWWRKDGIPGTACVDWPPMWEFFRKHATRSNDRTREIEFVTASPGVSAWSHWVGIEAQIRQGRPSSVRIQYDLARQRFTGTTDNVARLAIDAAHLEKGRTFWLELDGQKMPALELKNDRVWLSRDAGQWSFSDRPAAALKGPHRYGTFKDAFRNRVIFVYGTGGTAEENACAAAKARYDAEQFWYRGNGSIDIVSDAAFRAAPADSALADPNRNIVLYGNATTNACWPALLGDSPVQVVREGIRIGDRLVAGDDLGCVFIRPRGGSAASVGVVAGTTPAGMRLVDRLPYFVSGVGYPDCTVFGPEFLRDGPPGVRVAGFFGLDWGVESGEFVWGPEQSD